MGLMQQLPKWPQASAPDHQPRACCRLLQLYRWHAQQQRLVRLLQAGPKIAGVMPAVAASGPGAAATMTLCLGGNCTSPADCSRRWAHILPSFLVLLSLPSGPIINKQFAHAFMIHTIGCCLLQCLHRLLVGHAGYATTRLQIHPKIWITMLHTSKHGTNHHEPVVKCLDKVQ